MPGKQFSLGALDRKRLHDLWDEVIDSGRFTEGQMVRRLESAMTDRTNMHAVAFSSCGAGLYALFRQHKVRCRALVCNNTFYATGAMLCEAGHEPVIVDCSLEDFSMDYDALLPDVSMVVLTHVGGGVASAYKAIADWCHRNQIRLVEDAAHSLGVPTRGFQPGELGSAAVYSLYPTKAIPVGEGGIVVTNDAGVAEELREFRNYGKRPVEGRITYREGMNLRMDEWTAAVALLQVERIDEIVERRDSDAAKLSSIWPSSVSWESGTNWYKYIVEPRLAYKKTSGKVYMPSDQLDVSLKHWGISVDQKSIRRSKMVAVGHDCLPIGEGMYDGMTVGELEQYITRA